MLKMTQMTFIMGLANFKYQAATKTFKKHLAEGYSCAKKVTHVVIIPNYNDELELLRETLNILATHSRAMNYCIMLAMEKHEMNSNEKAQRLVKEYESKFGVISYTIHEIQPG